MNGNCPNCKIPVTQIKIKNLPAIAPDGTSWKCVTFCCNQCDTIISTSIDPVALNSDLHNDIVNTLKN